MNELGNVVALDGSYAIVNIKRNSACGSCKACELGTSNKGEININIENTLGAQVGDQVKVQMETPDILKAAFLVYMIPLLALLAGVTITYLIGNAIGRTNELLMILIGFAAMGGSLLYVRKKDKQLKKTNKFEPIMTELVKTLINTK